MSARKRKSTWRHADKVKSEAATAPTGGSGLPTHLHLARITIEAKSPISSASGAVEGVHDMALARDAAGLPMLLGSSIQGAVRALWTGADVETLFGFQEGGHGGAGRLIVSDAAVHGADDRSVPPLVVPNLGDPVLALLAEPAPLMRDHVRLGHAGAVDGDGKFERLAVPIGTRFSFEVAIVGAKDEKRVLETMIGVLDGPGFRLGGATNRGYGALKVERANIASLELATAKPGEVRAARALPLSAIPAGFKKANFQRPKSSWSVLRLELQPVGVWRVGQGGEETSRSGRPKTPKQIPVREVKISWNRTPAEVKTARDADYLVPGASVRGALAHRALFHYNCLAKRWAVPNASAKQMAEFACRPPALADLFGSERRGLRAEGNAARLIVDDAYVAATQPVAVFDHNSIDRFTGGVRNRILFSEETVFGRQKINLNLRLAPPRPGSSRPSAQEARRAIEALNLAIADLCQGRLAIGARSLGFCTAVNTAVNTEKFDLPAESPA